MIQKTTLPKISEDQLQAQCVRWFNIQYPDKLIYAIPNGGSRNKIEAAKLKRCGVCAGVPDLFISATVFNGKSVKMGLYIELKVGRNKLTDKQFDMHVYLQAQGYCVEICYTFEEFQKVVRKYFLREKV